MAFVTRARGNPVLHTDVNQYATYFSGTTTQEVVRVGDSAASYMAFFRNLAQSGGTDQLMPVWTHADSLAVYGCDPGMCPCKECRAWSAERHLRGICNPRVSQCHLCPPPDWPQWFKGDRTTASQGRTRG